MSLTEADLKAMEERANRAPTGPWAVGVRDGQFKVGPVRQGPAGGIVPPGHVTPLLVPGAAYSQEPETAAFVAAARSDVPALIAEVRRLRAALETAAMGTVIDFSRSRPVSMNPEIDRQYREAHERRLAALPPAPTNRIHLGGGCEVEVCPACYARVVEATRPKGGADGTSPPTFAQALAAQAQRIMARICPDCGEAKVFPKSGDPDTPCATCGHPFYLHQHDDHGGVFPCKPAHRRWCGADNDGCVSFVDPEPATIKAKEAPPA